MLLPPGPAVDRAVEIIAIVLPQAEHQIWTEMDGILEPRRPLQGDSHCLEQNLQLTQMLNSFVLAMAPFHHRHLVARRWAPKKRVHRSSMPAKSAPSSNEPMPLPLLHLSLHLPSSFMQMVLTWSSSLTQPTHPAPDSSQNVQAPAVQQTNPQIPHCLRGHILQ